MLAAGLAVLMASAAPARSPAAAALIPQNPRLGLTFSNYFDGNPMYARARQAGASYDRVEFQMSVINPAPGQWSWSGYDALVADEAAQGLRVLPVLTSPPGWAADPAYAGHYESWPVPANLNLAWNDPNNYWAQFVYQLVLHYKGRIHEWQVWNEPDIRKYWQMPAVPASLFAQLLRVSYQAIKAADPQATVVMGGFLYRHDQWPSPVTIWQAIRDLPASAANNNYFDVMAFHLYDGGTCEHFDVIEDFRQHMIRAEYGGLVDHPIWITESGIRQWEGQVGRNPGDRFATLDEAAAYVIQNYAYALHKDVGRYYYFRTTDDGDINRWGLIRQDASLRPAYTAYQVAAQYLPTSFTLSTRPNWYGNDANPVSRISFYGTPLGRVSVIWNVTYTAQTYALNAILPSATVVWQNGVTATMAASGGFYNFNLPAAQNFSWHNPPDECLVASPPLIVIEADTQPPTSMLGALPLTMTQSAIPLTWSGSDAQSGVWNYDVQVRQDSGAWADWLSWNPSTSAVYSGQPGHHYDFRTRARDRAGNEQGWASANIVGVTIEPATGLHAAAFLPLLLNGGGGGPVCQNPVLNGGFEQGSDWVINSTPYPAAYTQAVLHTGQWAMQTGIPLSASVAIAAYSSVSQTFTLPASSAPRLMVWRNVQTQDTLGLDLFYIRLADGAGTWHTLTETGMVAPGWQPLTFDLAAYTGQTVTLLLGTYNNGDDLKSVAYYDDVSVDCASAR
jgi:hypothetical protein